MKCNWMRGFVPGVLAATILGGATTVSAGDAARYADRASWPSWAVTYHDPERLYPADGELVDAVRFELIRGYSVAPQDFMQYEDREFRPQQAMTRAEFAAVLSRSQSLVTEDGAGANWYVPYVDALKARGIIPADASQDWNAAITRREAGQWMGRAADAFQADIVMDANLFVDVDDPLIIRALQSGIVKGTGQGRFEPDRSLLRVEAAVMLVRLARARNSEGHRNDPDFIARLQSVAEDADRKYTEENRRWVMQGEYDGLNLDGLATPELVAEIDNAIRDNLMVRPGPPRSWNVVDEGSYQFQTIEVHDTMASLGVCNLVKVYRATDPPEAPWWSETVCNRQFFVRRDGLWLIAATADLPVGSDLGR